MEPAQPDNEDRDDALATLIGHAGPRAQPSAAFEASVRAAVYAEWQRSLRKKRQQRMTAGLIAATVVIVCIAIGWRMREPRSIATPVQVASIAYIQGAVHFSSQPRGANAQAALYVGDDVSTARDGGARLLLSNQASIRLASNSHLRWRAVDDIELLDGSIYVDSGPQHAGFVIRTRYGVVAHRGTRYQVRAMANALQIAVRDGIVNVQTSQANISATAQQELKVDDNGQITTTHSAAYGAEWAWIDVLAPAFEIDNRSVDEFLHWVARETGHTLEYVDDATRVAATRAVLHGAAGQLTPTQALAAILPTTDFSARYDDERLLIAKR